jgi:hypothetical protein
MFHNFDYSYSLKGLKMNQVSNRKALALGLALIAAGLSGVARAESNFQTGAGALTATARVDFQITIPKFLYLQVGTGTPLTTVGTINLISFTVPAANVGDSSVISATAGSGDLGNGVVTAMVRGNNGNITLSSAAPAAISNGSGDSINWTEITTTAAALSTGTVLTPPTLTNSTTNSVTLTAVGKVVNQDARWTYKYANTVIVPPGTYGGVNINNSRVTYTAALP